MLGVCLDYRNKNYGSKLQALATVKALEEYGLDYEIIQYNKKTLRFILKYIPRFFNAVFLNDRYDQIQKQIQFRRHPEIMEAVTRRNRLFDAFDEVFREHTSRMYKSYEELKRECPKKYKRLLTCSDQLWSPSALGSGFYNLMFGPENMPKASWASSFGVSNIPWYQTKRTREYLRRIEYISTRENRGAEIVKELTGRAVPVLMDPVFYFDKKEWEKLIPVTEPEWEDYIFCYFLGDDPKHRMAAKKLAEDTGKKIVTLRHLDRFVAGDENFGDHAPYDVDPARFLNILRNASVVCTDSFHGAAFSVINGKKFIVFDRYSSRSTNSKNSRIDSLCQNLGLEGRRHSDEADITTVAEQEIDYCAVNEKLIRCRENTKCYLAEALGVGSNLKTDVCVRGSVH